VPVKGFNVFNGQNQNEKRIENISTQMKVTLATFVRVQIILERMGYSQRNNRSSVVPIAK
jgi:hypothetical protein